MKFQKLALVSATSILFAVTACSTSTEREESEMSTQIESSNEVGDSSDDQWKNSRSRKDPRNGTGRRTIDRNSDR